MKKLLSLLGTVVIGSTTVFPNVFLNTISEKDLEQNDSINLNIPIITQEIWYYCVPACIQMIFRFFNVDLSHYSQHQIFQDLDGIIGHGVIVDSRISNYLNNHISTSNYYYNDIPFGFARTQSERRLFQAIVYDSLFNNHPLILNFLASGGNNWHVSIISGITIDWENPELTVYRIIDPERFTVLTVSGEEIFQILIYGGALIANSFTNEFTRFNQEIIIDSHEVDQDYLNDYENHQVLDLRADLTATTGINQTGEFKNSFSKISLPLFNGEIYNFTWRKAVREFDFDTNNIPDNNDNWASSLVTIASSSEDVGSAHIEGRIVVQIRFERTKSLNHLLIHLIIYVGGISWSTGNWAHVWFKTGDLLTFIRKH